MHKFFIVGCPRSGTTMVQQALNRHSAVVIPPETKFFFSLLGQPLGQQLRHLRRLDADLGIRLPRPAVRITSAGDARALYEEMARQYVARLGKRAVDCFGEKTPEHTGRVGVIRRLFPGAKIIVLSRDGRDVALSLTRVPWMSPDLYVDFLVWLYYERVVRDLKAQGDPGLYFARYEDVVADPRAELGGMLRFLGLADEPAVAAGWGNKDGIPEREYAWKRRALEKITPERVGLFRRELSAEQIGVLERLGGHALSSLGYALASDGRAPLPAGLPLDVLPGLTKLLYRLPWRPLMNELLVRLSGPRPFNATAAPPTPALSHREIEPCLAPGPG
jgi:hypothetical protein